MSRLRYRIMMIPMVFLGLAGCGGPVEDTRPGQPVNTRQEAFKSMLRSFEPMGVMLRTNEYNPERFLQHATHLMQLRDKPWPLFGPDTNYPPTKAKPTVWSQPEAFERERLAFFAAMDALYAAALTRERAQVEPAYFRVYDTCESCHEGFKR